MKILLCEGPAGMRIHRFVLCLILLGTVSFTALAQESIVIEGTVISYNDSTPLPYVVVSAEGSHISTLTDDQGNYAMTVPVSTKEIVFQVLGYETKTISLDHPQLFKLVQLNEAEQVIDDVVVVGFGTQKKVSMVGAIQTIQPSELRVASTSLSTSFGGKIAGIISVQNSGEPGNDGASFWIRGISTFGTNRTPLLILDGVEIDHSILNALAPETIEQFSILKDATATALYGSRGANGVMIITTKSGRNSEKMAINVRIENGWTMPTRITKPATGVEYMNAYNEAMANSGQSQYYSQEKIDNTVDGTNPYLFPSTDWYGLMFKTVSSVQNVNINMRGGAKKVDYFLNLAMNNETGMLRNTPHSRFNTSDRMQKYTFQSNVSADMTKTTRVSLKMTTQLMNKKGSTADANSLFTSTMTANPVDFPAFFPSEPDDDHVRYGNAIPWDGGTIQQNPYAELNQGYASRFWANVLATLTVDQDLSSLTKGLRISALASFKNHTYSRTYNNTVPHYYKIDSYWLTPDGGYDYATSSIGSVGSNYLTHSVSNSGHRIYNIQGKIDWDRSFGSHDIAATMVYHQKEERNNVPSANQMDILPYREQGIAGRITYGYDTRYLLEANFGYNGSENFARGHRWGFFPSIAGGWVISNEPFFEGVKKNVTLLKLRASYGLVGNDALSIRFPYMTEVDMSSGDNEFVAYFGRDPGRYYGVQVLSWGNEYATWEEGRKLNLGLEFGFRNDLTLIMDLFREHRSGIFMQRGSIPSSVGLGDAVAYANIGEVLNRGIDLSIEYNKAFSKDFIVSAQGAFTFAHNEIMAKDEPNYRYSYQYLKGKPIDAVYGLVADGLFSSDEEAAAWPKQNFGRDVRAGDIRYLDLNGDGVIDDSDRTALGYPTVPEITYGFGVSVKYRNWDASFFFQGAARVSVWMRDHHPFVSEGLSGRNMSQWIVHSHWSAADPDPGAAYPRLSSTWHLNNTQTSSFWLKDGSYLRLKNVEVGYNWRWFRVYAAATNLFTVSGFKFWDPELGSGNGLSYPLQRVFRLGLQFNL